MRYQTIDTISFTDIYGKKFAIKDLREYPKYTTSVIVNLKINDQIDEVVTNKAYYGDGTEGEIYKVVEHNIEALFEAKFDSTKLKRLEIPIR